MQALVHSPIELLQLVMESIGTRQASL
jgi:hypothetical protein